MRILILPLLVLAVLASYVGGLGLARWHTPSPVEYLIAAAVHAAWILPATRRSSLALTTAGWVTALWLEQRGIETFYLAESDFLLALLIESVCLLLAHSVAPPETWADRLARWRRSRADIATQLRMGQGVVPWWRFSLRQFTGGAADTPVGSDYQRFAAALADSEHRLRIRINRATMPEQLRQSILESAAAIGGSAETSAAQRAIEVERQALAAAAACRDQCERLENLSPAERKALSSQCEQAFLELTRH